MTAAGEKRRCGVVEGVGGSAERLAPSSSCQGLWAMVLQTTMVALFALSG
jgi:hypothetical protein